MSSSFQDVMSIFKYLRSQGWRGTFMSDARWVVIVGTFQYAGPGDNDNDPKTPHN